MAEDFGDRLDSHEDMLRRLILIADHQRAINEDLREFTRQQVELNADVKTTLARIETLLQIMIRPAGNGRDA